jgi:hypothetical protein
MYFKILSIGSPNRKGETLEWIMPQDYHLAAPYTFMHLYPGRPITRDFIFPKLKLSKGAKLTDALTYVPISSDFDIVSGRFLSLIKEASVTTYSDFPFPILMGTETILYHAIHFDSSSDQDFIDWDRTTYKVQAGYLEVVEQGLKFSSREDFLSYNKVVGLRNHLHSLRIESLFVNHEFDLDLFYLRFPMTGLYCSENFYKRLLDNRITGLHITSI